MNISTIERLTNLLMPPRIPFQGTRDLDTIQRQRKICWTICALSGLICLMTWMTWILVIGKFVKPPKSPFIAIGLFVCYTVVSRATLFSARYFIELRDAFFNLRTKEIAEQLRRAGGNRWTYTVTMRSFLFHPDLEELQDLLNASFLKRIRIARAEKLREQNVRNEKRLRQAHEALDREILETAERLGKSYKVRRALRRNLALSRKRSMLSELVGFAVTGSQALHNPDRDEAKLNKLVGVLAELADGELCAEAKALHDSAKQATVFKEKERLLSAAIEAQRAYRRTVTAVPETETASVVREAFPVQYIQLWDRAREVFSVDGLLPPDVDAEMAKAVLLVLIDPGSRERIVQAKYRPADRLKRDVARYYDRIGRRFVPECFNRTVSRLHAEGILSSKRKTDERMYALTARPSAGKSPEAQVLIRNVVQIISVLKQ